MTLFAGAEETGGQFTVFQGDCPKGLGPPPHIHEREHESLFVLDGEIEAFVGEERFVVPEGGYIFLPQGLVHWFQPLTDVARMLAIAGPGGGEGFFWELGETPDEPVLPPPPNGPPDIPRFLATGERYGVSFPRPPGAPGPGDPPRPPAGRL